MSTRVFLTRIFTMEMSEFFVIYIFKIREISIAIYKKKKLREWIKSAYVEYSITRILDYISSYYDTNAVYKIEGNVVYICLLIRETASMIQTSEY